MEPWEAQLEAGNVHLVRGDWNQAYIDEHCAAPNGKYKDQIDASAGAFMKLAKNGDFCGVGQTASLPFFCDDKARFANKRMADWQLALRLRHSDSFEEKHVQQIEISRGRARCLRQAGWVGCVSWRGRAQFYW